MAFDPAKWPWNRPAPPRREIQSDRRVLLIFDSEHVSNAMMAQVSDLLLYNMKTLAISLKVRGLDRPFEIYSLDHLPKASLKRITRLVRQTCAKSA